MGTQILKRVENSAEIGFEPRLRRWTTAEFEHLIEIGVFAGQHAELINGEIIEMSPMLEAHAIALMESQDECYRVFSLREFGVRNQSPFYTGEGYRPEPDIAVVRRADLGTAPPTSAVLIIEISDSTLRYERTDKASLYARAGIADYWIVDVTNRVLEVRRTPRPDSTTRFGFGYGSLQTLEIGDSIAPLGAPDAAIAVADLVG